MADRIKGITIEIDGETTGLKQSLSGITKESISIQKELTDVQRLLKFDPGNTAALAQKQELLSKQIEVTSQKLKALKDAQSQVDAQFASGKIGEEQYRAFQREIQFTEASLNKFKTTYKEAMTPPTGDISQPITQLGKNVEESNSKLSGFSSTAKVAVVGGVAAIGAAMVGAGAVAIKLGDDYQQASNTLQTQTGATSEEMETLNQAMTNVYGNNFGESMQDIANSMVQVQTYLQGTGEDIQAATENAIGFRDAFGVEVPESMRSVQALMKQFGITSQEAFNLLAQGQQENLNYSGELYDSVNEYSVQFNKLGLDANDMFDIFKAGAENGAFNLDKVGDAVKELSIRVIDGSTTTKQGFQALGMNADEMAQKFGAGGDSAREAFFQVIEGLRNMNDPVQQSIAGVDLFGTQWEDLGPKVITQLDSMQTMFDKTTNTMQEINKVQYNTPIQALQGLGRQVETSVLLPISQNVMPALNDMVSKLQEAFSNSSVQAGISSLSDGISSMAEGFANFIANVLPNLLTGLGWIMENANTIATGVIAIGIGFETFKVVGVVNELVQGVKDLAAAQWVLNEAQKANVIGAVIAAVTALVAAVIYLWNTNEGFRDAIIGAWTTISTTVGSVCIWISEAWNTLWSALTPVVEPVIQAIAAMWSGFVDNVKGAWDILQSDWNTICNALSSIISPIISEISGLWIGFVSNVQGAWEMLKSSWNTVCSYLSPVIMPIIEGITAAWNGFQVAFQTVASGIQYAWDTVVSGIKDAWEGIKAPFQAVIDWIASAWESIKSKFKLPHFTFSGSMNPLEWGSEGAPSVGVDWYANGGIMTSPTLFGFNGNNAMVGGEAGPEAILPLSVLFKQMNSIMNDALSRMNTGNSYTINANNTGYFDNTGSQSALEKILGKMDSMENKIASLEKALDVTVNLDGQKVGKMVTPTVSNNLAFNNGRRGW